jgi:hypothetical protein
MEIQPGCPILQPNYTNGTKRDFDGLYINKKQGVALLNQNASAEVACIFVMILLVNG